VAKKKNGLAVADARVKALAYDALAERYLRAGETFLALHAQIAADIALAVSLGAEDPLRFARGRNADVVIERALSRTSLAPWRRLSPEASARDMLEAIRRFMRHRLPLSMAGKWGRALTPSTRFVAAPPVDTTLAANFAKGRLRNRDPYQWVNAKFRSADLYAQRALTLNDLGRRRQALRAWFASDLAAFEGWLVSRSIAAGDRLLVQTELRWELAMAAIEQIDSLPEDFNTARVRVRSCLAWAVGPELAQDLAKHLNQL
jgi:hypothetical protein